MGSPNTVEGILAGAKDTLAKANKFTESVEGNPTSHFAAKHEFSEASYKMAHAKKSVPLTTGEDIAKGLEYKKQNIDQYSEAEKNK